MSEMVVFAPMHWCTFSQSGCLQCLNKNMASFTKTGCQFTIRTKRVKGVVPWILTPQPTQPVLEISHVAWLKWRDFLGWIYRDSHTKTKKMGRGGVGGLSTKCYYYVFFWNGSKSSSKYEILGGGFINNCLFFVYFLLRSLGKRNSHFDEHFLKNGSVQTTN